MMIQNKYERYAMFLLHTTHIIENDIAISLTLLQQTNMEYSVTVIEL